MRVRMLETRRGSADGYTIRQYQRGEIYDLPESLARAFFAAGFASPLSGKKSSRRKSSRRMIRLIKE